MTICTIVVLFVFVKGSLQFLLFYRVLFSVQFASTKQAQATTFNPTILLVRFSSYTLINLYMDRWIMYWSSIIKPYKLYLLYMCLLFAINDGGNKQHTKKKNLKSIEQQPNWTQNTSKAFVFVCLFICLCRYFIYCYNNVLDESIDNNLTRLITLTYLFFIIYLFPDWKYCWIRHENLYI